MRTGFFLAILLALLASLAVDLSMTPLQRLLENLRRVIVGKEEALRLTLLALLADGHLLIEDVPGLGKTMFARALARSLAVDFKRVQFTPDLLPADLTGTNIFQPRDQTFEFREGPVFTNVLLADEINRATPRTQSALLEAMEERQVSVDGETHPLASLFFVIATQNPLEQRGVYALPEAQLDRFLMKISLGYPSADDEVRIIGAQRLRHPIETLEAVCALDEILEARRAVREVHVDGEVAEYAVRIVHATRRHAEVLAGGSPRASIALTRLAQARSVLDGEKFVVPDAVKSLAKPVLRHRLILRPQARISGVSPDQVIEEALATVDVPLGR
jgi:MoxR-like ATPase